MAIPSPLGILSLSIPCHGISQIHIPNYTQDETFLKATTFGSIMRKDFHVFAWAPSDGRYIATSHCP